jgi:hypothetical protein
MNRDELKIGQIIGWIPPKSLEGKKRYSDLTKKEEYFLGTHAFVVVSMSCFPADCLIAIAGGGPFPVGISRDSLFECEAECLVKIDCVYDGRRIKLK